jgi:nitroimidazol reductase NimA-like FMN-containing flavoprotein (pyridoxamine 5'-phosphate oxidase superfamily)
MIGELAPERIERILHEQVVGRIGCHARGRTYVVPTTYAYTDGAILCHTGQGLKIEMMRSNPEVCFEVEDLRHLPSWASVIVYGTYEELHGDAADRALDEIRARLTASPPTRSERPFEGAGKFEPGTYAVRPDVVFQISIHEKTGRYDE